MRRSVGDVAEVASQYVRHKGTAGARGALRISSMISRAKFANPFIIESPCSRASFHFANESSVFQDLPAKATDMDCTAPGLDLVFGISWRHVALMVAAMAGMLQLQPDARRFSVS